MKTYACSSLAIITSLFLLHLPIPSLIAIAIAISSCHLSSSVSHGGLPVLHETVTVPVMKRHRGRTTRARRRADTAALGQTLIQCRVVRSGPGIPPPARVTDRRTRQSETVTDRAARGKRPTGTNSPRARRGGRAGAPRRGTDDTRCHGGGPRGAA
eukprot:765018-Hanusia_phi.AAC.5